MLDAVVHFAAPYRLPSPDDLGHAVVVLDLGFCADQGARRFETVTQPFIEGLGPNLSVSRYLESIEGLAASIQIGRLARSSK